MGAVIDFFVREWVRSPNPAWLKAFMVLALLAAITYVVRGACRMARRMNKPTRPGTRPKK